MEQIAMSLVGGLLIGLAASLLLMATGRLAGVSGMVAGLLPPEPGDWTFRAWFLGGLMLAGVAGVWLVPETIGPPLRSIGWLAFAGLLVGFGTRMSGGCTSGHGICGISRFAPRSILATVTFMAVAMLTVAVLGVAGVTP